MGKRFVGFYFVIVSSFFVGCSTIGRPIDEKQVNGIQLCKTTEREILSWFGKPSDLADVPGFKILGYQYAKANMFGSQGSSSLKVYLNEQGRVVTYAIARIDNEGHAAVTQKGKPQDICPSK